MFSSKYTSVLKSSFSSFYQFPNPYPTTAIIPKRHTSDSYRNSENYEMGELN